MQITIYDKDIYLFIKELLELKAFYTIQENSNALSSCGFFPFQPIFFYDLHSLSNLSEGFLYQKSRNKAFYVLHWNHKVSICSYAK